MSIVIVSYSFKTDIILCFFFIPPMISLAHYLFSTRHFIEGGFLTLHRLTVRFGRPQSAKLFHQSDVLFPELAILLLQLRDVLFFQSTRLFSCLPVPNPLYFLLRHLSAPFRNFLHSFRLVLLIISFIATRLRGLAFRLL